MNTAEIFLALAAALIVAVGSVSGEWSVCIGPSGNLLCAFPPGVGG